MEMLFIALICIVVGLYFIGLETLRSTRSNEPPYLSGARPLLGHLPSLFVDSTQLWTLLSNSIDHVLSLGGTARVGLGPKTVYVVADPDDMLVVANNCLDKATMYEFGKPWVGDGLLTSNGSTWKKHRKLLNPAFSQTVLDNYITIFNDQARKLVKDMKNEVGKGLSDQFTYFKITSLETICRTAFGVDLTDSQQILKYNENIGVVMNTLVHRLMKFWLHPSQIFRFSQLKKKQDESINVLHDMSNSIIQKIKSEFDGNVDTGERFTGTPETKLKPFTKILLELSQKGAFTNKELREHADTMIGAGTDSSAVSLLLITILLGAYPTVQEKVLAELKEVLGDEDRDVEKKDLSQLVYLEAVIKESLRLYTVTPVILRKVDRDIKLKNCTLYAGHTCCLLLFGVHLHSLWGPDRYQFRPERWLDPSQLPKNANLYAAFAVGKRSCIGKVYALMFLKTILAHLVQHYKIAADDRQLRLKMDLTLKPVSGHFISIEDRKSL